MTALDCCFGYFATSERLPQWLSNSRQSISDVFAVSSNNDIQLNVSQTFSVPRSSRLIGANAVELQTVLQSITDNAKAPSPPSKIGLIFADEYSPHPKTFGIMFDPGPGFAGLTDPDGIPREGCAIFLRPIRLARQNTTPQETGVFADPFEAETFFTAIHELGHVFNLWHSELAINYMRSSALRAVAAKSDEGFVSPHREVLELCSKSDIVRPGGRPFGVRDSLGPTDGDLLNGPQNLRGLKMAIRLTDEEFFSFQPVELEIDVSVINPQESIDVPDIFDPGYDGFDIMVEDPDGQRRKIRSPRRYCPCGDVKTISAREQFHRDISVFGDADGFVFRQPGLHKVWATIRFSKRQVLTSNKVECTVLTRRDAPRTFAGLAPLLLSADMARLFYHRFAPLRSRNLEMLTAAIPKLRRVNRKVGSEAHYVLGRAFAAHALRNKQKSRREALVTVAYRHFTAATDGDSLSRHRQRVIKRVVNSLS